jgi:hypothetical protein
MAKLGRYSANRIKIEELTASKTLEVVDCGTLFLVNPTADTTLTLPSAFDAGPGWWIDVMLDEQDTSDSDRTTDQNVNIATSDGTFLTGFLGAADGAGASVGNGTSHDHIVFDDDNSNSGERVTIISLGDRFVAHGYIVDATDTKFHTAAL